ncbi:MAG: MMPL family transporter [Candidatus Binataceae bacterium]|nr:MMPL family transporter [Candidatus Binataceae bacterium]
MKQAAIVWLIVVGCAAALLILRLHRGVALQTDLTALLVPEKGDAAVRRGENVAAAKLAQRIFVLAGDNDRASARKAGAAIADGLTRSGLTLSVNYRLPPDRLIAMGAMYFPYRFGLLTNGERTLLEHRQGSHIVDRALASVYGPESIADAAMLRRDPFLLLPAFLGSLPLPLARVALDDGVLTVHDGAKTWVLISAQLNGNAYSLAYQNRFATIFDGLTQSLRRQTPGLAILRVGAIFYAHRGAQSAIRETSLIATVSMAGTIILILGVFRDMRPLWLTLLAIAVGVVCAFSVCLSLFGGIHVVVLLFGVSLIGIAIDYCLQYITARLGPDSGSPRERLRSVLPGITLGVITTLIGYTTLMLAPFPGLRQLAVFSAVGLSASFLTVVLWLPLLDSAAPLGNRERLLNAANLLWAFWRDDRYRRWRLGFIVLCALTGLAGLSRLRIDDDLRHQQALSVDLRGEELKIRRLTGMTGGTDFMLVQAPDLESALQREEALIERLAAAQADGALRGFQALAQFIPSIRRQREDADLVRDRLMRPFLDAYYKRLGVIGGMQPDVAIKGFLTPDAISPNSPIAFVRSLTLESGPDGITQVILLNGVRRPDDLRRLAKTVPGVHFADPAGEVTRILSEYRRRAVILIIVSILLMMPVLLWRYGLRGSVMTLLPPMVAVILAPEIAALMGVSFTFFGAIALVLVLSIGFDYAVFCREAAPARRPITMLGVGLAMLATLLSFGLLGFSRTYAVHAFGVTLLAGMILAFVLSPLASDPGKDS